MTGTSLRLALERQRCALLLAALVLMTSVAGAQATGTVSGRVTQLRDGAPLPGVVVSITGTMLSGRADAAGRYTIRGVPAGERTVSARWLGYRPIAALIQVGAGTEKSQDLQMEAVPPLLSEVLVTTASRAEERLVTAPAAIGSVDPLVATSMSATGQLPLVLASVPGVDIAQSGINEFNLNTRGFNSTLNRRVLVLQDGRDLSIAFLGSQEWTALALPLEDMRSIELIRGPGSALYGANAFNGVLDITTPAPREIVGTKVSVAGGSLGGIRFDARHAGLFASERFGYKANIGYSRSDSWTRSRTNVGDLRREYENAIDTTEHPIVPPLPGFELRPLNGQTKTGTGNAPSGVTGTPDPVTSLYGSARLDYYQSNDRTMTAEVGGALVKNEVFLSAIGRAQVLEAVRPFARLAWRTSQNNLMAWWSGRQSLEPQYSLASGGRLEEKSNIVHLEGQTRRNFMSDRARVVVGASARSTYADSRLSFLAPEDDKRTDGYYSLYGQFEYTFNPKVRIVTAARWDDGNLFESQISPRAGLVYSPTADHSFRATYGRAFQTSNTLEYFLSVNAGAPANFVALENALRASPLGPALAGVPQGELFTNSSAVPIRGLGNRSLEVERIVNAELGYKGTIARRLFVTVDLYHGRITDFVTRLLPGVNPNYRPWTAPDEVPEANRAAVEDAVRSALLQGGSSLAAAGLTRLASGATAIVLSYGNAGRAIERGVELGTTLALSGGITVTGNYTYFDSEVAQGSLVPGQSVVPNTPRHKGFASVAYTGSRFDARASIRVTDSFDWSSGVFIGHVPANQTIDLTAGYNLTSSVRAHVVGTNVFDQQRYQMFGGSVIGRRVLLGATYTF